MGKGWRVVDTGEKSAATASRSRIPLLLTALNLVLVSALLYANFGRSLTPSGGVAVSLSNDTPVPLIDLVLEYPGGTLDLPRLGVGERVGVPIANVREFQAKLRFKTEAGGTYEQTFPVKPLGEFLVLIDVLPVLEETTVKTAAGPEETYLRMSAGKVRVQTSYQGAVTYD